MLETAGGFPSLTYTLTPTSSIPVWMTLEIRDRTINAITGTPDAASTFELTVTVTDTNGVTDDETFTVTVHSAPTFADATTIPNQVYTAGQEVALTLPEASGGGYGTLSYVLTRTDGGPGAQIEAPGLTAFNPETRTISGTTSQAYGGDDGANLRYTVWDANGASTTRIDFTMQTVAAPTFSTTIANQNYTAGIDVNLALPAAGGGVDPLTYTLTPIPAELSFNADPDMRTLTGIPTTSNPNAADLTYTVTDANGITATQTFTVTVFSAPTIAAIGEQVYTVGQEVTLTLPKASGADPLSYTLARDDGTTPTLPPGLTFNPMTPSIEGMPSEPFGDSDGISMRYTATDTNGVTGATTFTLRVFGFGTATIDAQNYTVDVEVNLTLPAVGGGADPLDYTLEPTPTGLSFNADTDTRTLTGTPTAGSTDATLTYTVTDANGLTDNLTFMVAFNAAALTVTGADVNEGEGDGTTSFTVRLSRAVSGGFSVSATLGGTGTGTATADEDYTADASQTLTFDGTVGETHTISVTILDDDLAEGPETLMLSLGTPQDTDVAVYSDFIGTITITDNDVATLTIENDITGEPSASQERVGTVRVTLNKTVPGGFQVRLRTEDGTATAGEDYDAIDTILTFNGNKGQTRSVTTNILHDTTPEIAENFTVSLSELQGTQAEVDIRNTGNINITLNDGGIVSFGDIDIADQVYLANTDITPLILPEPIEDEYFFHLESFFQTPLPDGLTFNENEDEGPPTISGRPTTVATTTLIYTAQNFAIILGERRDNTGAFRTTSASLTFTVTITATGVGVLHYSDAAATTSITDVVSSGDVYSVVAFGTNVNNVDAQDTTARPAIAYTLDTDTDSPVQFGIVAHNAALNSGECQAESADDTSSYTCRYSLEGSGANAAVNDPGAYTVSVSVATVKASNAALVTTNQDSGVIIAVRPRVMSVTFYSDIERNDVIVDSVTTGDVIYMVVEFSENMENINGDPTGADNLTDVFGKPDINYWRKVGSSGRNIRRHISIVAHNDDLFELGDSCKALSATNTREYLCRLDLADTIEYFRIEVLQEGTRDQAGYPLVGVTLTADNKGAEYQTDVGYHTADILVVNAAPAPMVMEIIHFSDAAGNTPISDDDVVSGGNIYSEIQFENQAFRRTRNNPKISYQLGSAPPVALAINLASQPGPCVLIASEAVTAANQRFRCHYNVGATAEGEYRIIVGEETMDVQGLRLGTDYISTKSVNVSALRFGTEIADQNYTVDQSVALTLPEGTHGVVGTLSYALTQDDGSPLTLPTGLTFDAAARSIKGTPAGSSIGYDGTLRYTVMDGYGSSVPLTFRLRVFDAPTFGAESTIAAQNYTVGTTVNLTLPAVIGAAPLTYTLTPIPDGLTFDAMRTLKGTPTTPSDAATLTYTVTDANGLTDNQTFMVTIYAPMLSIADDVEVGEGVGMATVTVRLDNRVPDGFRVDAFTSNISATAGTDYTAVISRTLTFAGNAGEIQTFSVTIVNDAIDEGDEDVRLLLSNLQGTSVPVDISNTATLTITDDDSGLTVESVRFYTNEAAAITGDETTAITEAAISTNVYIAIQFSENVQNTVTSYASSTTPRIVGRPGIYVAINVPPIIAPGAAFKNISACRAISDSDTSTYICKFFLHPGVISSGSILVRVLAALTIDTAGNRLAMDDNTNINVVAWTMRRWWIPSRITRTSAATQKSAARIR